MWEETKRKIERLGRLDKQRQVFGASNHYYELLPPLSEEELQAIEQWLGVALPPELRAFYKEVGDGVAGPHYGLKSSVAVTPYRASEPYTDIATFRARSKETNGDDSYLAIASEDVTGLIGIIDEGCGRQTCMVTSGPRTGEVVSISEEGSLHETNLTFHQFYEQ